MARKDLQSRLEYSREYEKRPEVRERRKRYYQETKDNKRRSYPSRQLNIIADYNKEYRKTHTREHNEESRRFYQRHRERIDLKNKNWIKTNPQSWQKIALKSQKKYLSRLGKSFGLVYHKLPYLYTQWSRTVKDQYNNKCAICEMPADHSHHIFHKSKYPELSLNLNNGVPLCLVHHNEVHGRLIT